MTYIEKYKWFKIYRSLTTQKFFTDWVGEQDYLMEDSIGELKRRIDLWIECINNNKEYLNSL